LASAAPFTDSDGQLLIVDTDLVADAHASTLCSSYHVTTADDLTGARRLLQHNRPALVITEMTLRDGSGTEVCRLAKSLDTSTAVLVITAHPDHQLRLREQRRTWYACLACRKVWLAKRVD
jgi:DNA-binding response OmpR family regulator